MKNKPSITVFAVDEKTVLVQISINGEMKAWLHLETPEQGWTVVELLERYVRAVFGEKPKKENP